MCEETGRGNQAWGQESGSGKLPVCRWQAGDKVEMKNLWLSISSSFNFIEPEKQVSLVKM